MSTGKNNRIGEESYGKRFAQIAQLGETLFHAKDLANLWGIRNANTLYTTLKRYTRQDLLFRVQKGLYSLKPILEIDPKALGLKALHEYAYVSCETILSEYGIMHQHIAWITLVSSQSRKFALGGHRYYSRKLADRFLFNPTGIIEKSGVRQATVERAIADLLYFNPRAYLDEGKSRFFDRKAVQNIQQQIGYPENYSV